MKHEYEEECLALPACLLPTFLLFLAYGSVINPGQRSITIYLHSRKAKGVNGREDPRDTRLTPDPVKNHPLWKRRTPVVMASGLHPEGRYNTGIRGGDSNSVNFNGLDPLFPPRKILARNLWIAFNETPEIQQFELRFRTGHMLLLAKGRETLARIFDLFSRRRPLANIYNQSSRATARWSDARVATYLT